MLFLVEDGTGVEGATSYVSLEAANDYAEFWDFEEWLSLDDHHKQRYLMMASDYLDSTLTYPSTLLTSRQGLLYPRQPFVNAERRLVRGIPDLLQEATIRIAVLLEEGLDTTAKAKVLKSQSYGSSREEYLGAWSEASSTQLKLAEILRKLNKQGLGGRAMTQVDVIRG